jgi:calcium/calmodulin-dependent protein kinase I
VEEADDILYLVMEMMNGGELFDHIIAKNTLTEREASNIIRQVASAIDYCHKKNIIHRDLKPENLLLVEKRKLDSVKIADFGFSKAIPSGGSTKSVLGSPGYVAPEIRQGRDYGPAVDIWSLGVIMYVMLFGYMPFDCDTDVIDEDENLEQYFKLDFEEEGWQNVSQGARTLLVKMLQPDYARRPTALQVFNDPWVRGDNVSDSALPSTGHLMKNPGSRREAGKRTVDINKLADQLQRGEITLEQFQEISKGGSPAPQSSTQLADINVGGV